ncbi:unnamed protein product [Meloidogyne enterolobii]|uniref:Uncharacterized protein n=1 Tax=Meloidogyne enterolobii TaxID=390850 RepID=A0ACB0Y3L9_MELEN
MGLRKFLDTIERVCRQLGDYGIQDDSWIIFTIKEKLPRGILAKLIEKERMAKQGWKVETWRSELDMLISVKEEVQRCTLNKEPEGLQRRDRRPFHNPEPTRSFPVASQPKKPCCSLCQGNHYPSKCIKYGNPQARKDRLIEQNRCLKCLREGHRANDCPNRRCCSKCQGPHHFLVCFSRDARNHNRPKFGGFNQRTSVQPSRPTPVSKPKQFTQSHPIWERRDQPYAIERGTKCDAKLPAPKENSVVATVMDAKNKPTAYLMTKKLMVSARGRKEKIPVYVFFDTGSQTSFVSRRLVEKLNPPRGREVDQLEIHGFGGALSNPLKILSPTYLIKIQRTDGNWEEMALNCTEEIATPFDMLNVDETYFSNHNEFEIVREKPDIMIGIRQFWKFFVSKGKEILPGLHSIRTVFGTMTAGETNFGHNSDKASMSLVAVHSSNEEHLPTPSAVEDFWNLESLGIKENPSQNDDDVATKLIEKSITVTNEGRYSVRWPWKEENPKLDSNFKMAYSRLMSVLEGLKGSDILEKYDTQIKNQLAEGIIEEADRNPNGLEHYLPHHGVVTHKLRIVYDASAHRRGNPSLNECLYRGPVLLPDLAGLLLRFRCPKYPVLADIQAAFLTIELEPDQREVCKFLWMRDVKQPVSSTNLIVYRICRVGFGIICSPAILAVVIRHHLAKNAKLEMANNLYVDNLLLECETIAEADTKCTEAKEIFAQAKMNLREFISHSPQVMNSIASDDRLKVEQYAKVLGMKWQLESDGIHFEFPGLKGNVPSRRSILSVLASVYDPMGLVSPCLLPAKCLFQDSWNNAKDWDDVLPDSIATRWKAILTDWDQKSIDVPRKIIVETGANLELHTFVGNPGELGSLRKKSLKIRKRSFLVKKYADHESELRF